jgi:tetratricopeptide (TPR) repeat protein
MPESDYAARPPIPRSAFEAYIRGVMSVDAERRSELLADAVRLHPQYMSAIYQLGLAHYLDSDYQQSNGLLERVSSDSPEYPMARFMIGMNAYHLNDFGKAAAIYSTIEPSYDILVNLGASLAAGGDPLAAESVLKRALEKNPAGSEAIFDLAYVAFIKGDWTVAVFARSRTRLGSAVHAGADLHLPRPQRRFEASYGAGGSAVAEPVAMGNAGCSKPSALANTV